MAISKRELWAPWGARLVFLASAATLAAALVARMPLLPIHELRQFHLLDGWRDYHFFDLRVYRRAAAVVASGRPLYASRLSHGLGFTYPPVAALIFLALRWLSVREDELAVTIVNIVLVAAIALMAVRLQRPAVGGAFPWRAIWARGAQRRHRRAWAGWLAAAVMLWLEPVTTTLGYGQIDLLIAALVIVDLVYGRSSRAGGLGIGIAAALKLTPLIFIPYLALTGRRRMAIRALCAFALLIALEFAAGPGDASTYWFGGKFMDFSRVTGGHHLAGSGAANQSLRGALLRIFPGAPDMTVIWILGCVIVGVSGLLLAVRAARRGDEAWGFLLVALTGLLISPVSWTHHWTIAVAGAVALFGSGHRPAVSVLGAAGLIAVGLATETMWFDILHPPAWSRVPAEGLLLSNIYVLAALGALVTAAALEFRHVTQRRTFAARGTRFAPVVSAALTATAPRVKRLPGHPVDPVRAMTTSQALAADRQSLG